MDAAIISQLIADGKYVALLAVSIGLVVRLLKSDTKIPIDIPSKHRRYLALALALAGGVVDKLAHGLSWKQAVLHGLLAWFFADWGHKLFIEDLRGGREIALPGLTLPGVAPSPGKPVSVPPEGGATEEPSSKEASSDKKEELPAPSEEKTPATSETEPKETRDPS